jgi:hypothetical protein
MKTLPPHLLLSLARGDIMTHDPARSMNLQKVKITGQKKSKNVLNAPLTEA